MTLLTKDAAPVEVKTSFFQQPAYIPPPKLDYSASKPVSRRNSLSLVWNSDTRTLLSRASSIASHATRKSRSRQHPTIGTPTNFRRLNTSSDGPDSCFRPLELSIYVPGNELPSLPSFNKNGKIEFPPPVILKRSRSETVLSRASIYAIPTAASGSLRGLPQADSIYSYDDNASLSPSMLSRSHSIYIDVVTALPQSSQAFLDLLDEGPRPPVPLKVKSRTRSRSPKTVRRNASDQNMRLRAHLEEREQMECRLQDFDTILEEWRNSTTSSEQETASRLQAAFQADSTGPSPLGRPRIPRAPKASKSTHHLPHARRPPAHIPDIPETPRHTTTAPVSAYNTTYASPSPPRRPRYPPPSTPPLGVPPPIPPPSYAPPPVPFSARPFRPLKPPHWRHSATATATDTDTDDYQSIINLCRTPREHDRDRHLSGSSAGSEGMSDGGFSEASTWSTPRSTPRRVESVMYSLRPGWVDRDVMADGRRDGKGERERGVAF